MAASATELWNSREGSSSGIDGVENVTTTWAVVLNTPTDDPITTLRGLAVTPGTVFPWTTEGCVATKFIRAEHPSPLLWHVVVLYEVQALSSITAHWAMEISAGLETEHIDFDVNGYPIGQPRYMTDGAYQDYFRATNIGPPPHPLDIRLLAYEQLANYKSLDGDLPVTLHRATGTTAEPFDFSHFSVKGADRTKPSAVLTLSRTFPHVSTTAYTFALSALNKLNYDVFYGAPADTLKLIAANVRETKGVADNQRIDGIVFDVSLSFLWNPDKHMPLKTYHTFTGDDSTEHPITGPGGVQWTQNDLYERESFWQLLGIFE